MMLAVVVASCVAVLGPKILAHDLAQAVPAFVPTDANAVVGYAPTPGVTRFMHAVELRQLLRQQGFSTDAPIADTCFARPVALLQQTDVIAAMRRSLGEEAKVEIVELSHFPAPPGQLVFPRELLSGPPIALWHGYVLYDGNSRFPVWARVKVAVPSRRVIATDDLRQGTIIQSSQLKLVTEDAFPDSRVTPDSVADAVGCLPRRFIPAHTPLWKEALDPPLTIARGDKVTVAVRAGQAQLSVVAEAEANGRRGDWIALKNLESGKTIRARVESEGRATVDGNVGKP